MNSITKLLRAFYLIRKGHLLIQTQPAIPKQQSRFLPVGSVLTFQEESISSTFRARRARGLCRLGTMALKPLEIHHLWSRNC